MATSFDHLVGGGGTAGVIIASRLSKYLPLVRIALVEAGPNTVHHPKVNNVSDAIAWIDVLSEGLVIDHSTTPQSWTWKILVQKHDEVLQELDTHFDSSADKEIHGFEGPIHIVGGRKYPMRDIIQQSAEAIGHRYSPIAAKGGPIGLVDFVQCLEASSDGKATRQHSAKVYDLSNVELFCGAPVARVLLDNEKRATGVEFLYGIVLKSSKEVILSCGTQRTPQLLMLSGIGPASEMSRQKIPVLVDAPAVGQNLFDHSAFTSHYKLKDSSKGYSKPFSGGKRANHG